MNLSPSRLHRDTSPQGPRPYGFLLVEAERQHSPPESDERTELNSYEAGELLSPGYGPSHLERSYPSNSIPCNLRPCGTFWHKIGHSLIQNIRSNKWGSPDIQKSLRITFFIKPPMRRYKGHVYFFPSFIDCVKSSHGSYLATLYFFLSGPNKQIYHFLEIFPSLQTPPYLSHPYIILQPQNHERFSIYIAVQKFRVSFLLLIFTNSAPLNP